MSNHQEEITDNYHDQRPGNAGNNKHFQYIEILVMQPSLVVCHGIFRESLVFSRCTHESLHGINVLTLVLLFLFSICKLT